MHEEQVVVQGVTRREWVDSYERNRFQRCAAAMGVTQQEALDVWSEAYDQGRLLPEPPAGAAGLRLPEEVRLFHDKLRQWFGAFEIEVVETQRAALPVPLL